MHVIQLLDQWLPLTQPWLATAIRHLRAHVAEAFDAPTQGRRLATLYERLAGAPNPRSTRNPPTSRPA